MQKGKKRLKRKRPGRIRNIISKIEERIRIEILFHLGDSFVSCRGLGETKNVAHLGQTHKWVQIYIYIILIRNFGFSHRPSFSQFFVATHGSLSRSFQSQN